MNVAGKTLNTERSCLLLAMLSHFFVDTVCIFLIVQLLDAAPLYCILYNFLAFATQPVFGYLSDKGNKYISVIGVILVFIGSFMYTWPMAYMFYFIALPLMGIGNSMFHAGSATMILNKSEGRVADIGIFASAGALGVYAGETLSLDFMMIFSLSALVLTACMLVLYKRSDVEKVDFKYIVTDFMSEKPVLFTVLAFVAIVAQMMVMGFGTFVVTDVYFGDSMNFDAIQNCVTALLIFAGRFLGGILADKRSIRPSLGMIALVNAFSSWQYIFMGGSWVLTAIMYFFLSLMTAPFICALAELYPKNVGVAFGITKTATFIGSLIPYVVLHFYSFMTEGSDGYDYSKLFGFTVIVFIVLYCLYDFIFRKKKTPEGDEGIDVRGIILAVVSFMWFFILIAVVDILTGGF